jgi:hypothetical protein
MRLTTTSFTDLMTSLEQFTLSLLHNKMLSIFERQLAICLKRPQLQYSLENVTSFSKLMPLKIKIKKYKRLRKKRKIKRLKTSGLGNFYFLWHIMPRIMGKMNTRPTLKKKYVYRTGGMPRLLLAYFGKNILYVISVGLNKVSLAMIFFLRSKRTQRTKLIFFERKFRRNYIRVKQKYKQKGKALTKALNHLKTALANEKANYLIKTQRYKLVGLKDNFTAYAALYGAFIFYKGKQTKYRRRITTAKKVNFLLKAIFCRLYILNRIPSVIISYGFKRCQFLIP